MGEPKRITRRRALLLALAAGVGGIAQACARRGPERAQTRGSTTTTAPDAGTTSTSTSTSTTTNTTVAEEPTISDVRPRAELLVICREAWKAAAARPGAKPHEISRLTVHHTASALDDNREAPRRLRGYQQYHQRRGFSDFAYHYFIDARGHVYQGRDETVVGDTFTDYDPSGHFLVVLDGNFEVQDPPGPQVDSLVTVLAWAAARHGVAPDEIRGHRAYARTACPGQALARLVDDGSLAARVRARMTEVEVAMRVACGDEGRAAVAAIERGSA